MRRMRLTSLAVLTAALWTMSGCVELTGQRITWFYDAAKDELHFLIHYDGIHDSGSDEHGKGTEQIPKFVAGGDVMLLDWPFHVDMADVRKTLEDEDADAREKQLARRLASFKVKPIGYYREPDGRIGAAQLVTIPQAKQFVREINDLLNQEISEDTVSPASPMARTEKRFKAAAKHGHQWLRLDGHAIRLTVPVHPDEWARVKGEFLRDFGKELAREFDTENPQQNGKLFQIAQVLASLPVSYVDRGDRVTFAVGRPDVPSTARFTIRDDYDDSLEKVLLKAVPVELDKTLANTLLDGTAKRPPEAAAILDWGPPEERVRALLAAARQEEPGRKKAALDQLEKWGTRWNREHGVPKAPAGTDKPEDYPAAWQKWYKHMKRYPLLDREPADADG